jgi:hypothetical protein
MFFAEAQIRVHLYGQPADMRKSYDGLQALARHAMGADPLDGSLYVFVNRRRDQTTFSIPIVFCHDRVWMASVTWKEGWTVSPHGSTRCPGRPS